MERQLELDSMAKARDVMAVVGIGVVPGLSNLLAVHTSQQFDRVEDVQLRYHSSLSDWLSGAADELRKTGRVDASWQVIVSWASGPVRIYRDERWIAIDPLENGADIAPPEGGTVTAYPVATTEPITLPRYLPGVQSVSSVFALSPPQLNTLHFREAQRISRGELTIRDATRSFLETVGTDPDHWLRTSYVPDWRTWVVATGRKDGRRARYTCWPVRLPHFTSIALTIATVRMLKGEVSTRGVLPPEACFEPMPFFEEAAQYAREEDRGKPLLGESWEWLP